MKSSRDEGQRFDAQASGRELLSLFSAAEEGIIIAPFVTKAGLAPLLEVISQDAIITLYTRWRANEVAAGVSDPNVFDLIAERGGKVRLHHLLHAKAYVRSGQAALIGSANLTGFGLGWHGAGGVELLIQVSDEHPALRALIRLLEVTSCDATEEIRDNVIEQATAFGKLSSSVIDAVGISEVSLGAWLPSYARPYVLWRVYSGQREEAVARLAAPDLRALDPPSGLSESEFNAYVASTLLQGLPGKMAEQLCNQTTYQAVRKLKELADRAGLTVEDPEQRWRTLSAWLAHFLPARYTRGAGGPTLYG